VKDSMSDKENNKKLKCNLVS